MDIPEQLNCLFSGEITERDGSFVIDVPERELNQGRLREHEVYRVALLSSPTDAGETRSTPDPPRDTDEQRPPVDTGETRTVEIEDIGDQGDGITRVERGYVVIVPGAEQGERVRVEITDVRENVAFATVVERLSYYE